MNSNSKQKILDIFQKQIIRFIEDLQGFFPNMPELVVAKAYFSHGVGAEKIMNGFIKHILPLKKQISDRDENFFLERDDIFGSLPKTQIGKVGYFKELFRSGQMSTESKENAWKYFDVFICLAEKYKKND